MKVRLIFDKEFDIDKSEDKKLFEALSKTFLNNWYVPKPKVKR